MKKYKRFYLNTKKIKKHTFRNKKKAKSKSKFNRHKYLYIFKISLLLFCILTLIFKFAKIYLLFPQIFNHEQYIKDKKIIESLKVCICTIGKWEK